jgi:hypothetical protein
MITMNLILLSSYFNDRGLQGHGMAASVTRIWPRAMCLVTAQMQREIKKTFSLTNLFVGKTFR